MSYKIRYASAVFLIIGAYLYLAVAVTPSAQTLFIPCPFLRLTGIPCPGCGMGRAVWNLLHGDFYQAFLLNIFSCALVLFSILAVIWMLKDIFFGHESFIPSLKKPWKPVFLIPILAVIFLSWIVKVYLFFFEITALAK